MRKFMGFVRIRCRQLKEKEEGAVMIIAAFFIVILMVFAALAIDFGLVYYKESQLQTAVDIAARAAAQIMAIDDEEMSEGRKEAMCIDKIYDYLEANGFPRDEIDCDIELDAEEGVSIDVTTVVELGFAKTFTDDDATIKVGSGAVTGYTEIEGSKCTVDVVFVLDISGSMYLNFLNWYSTNGGFWEVSGLYDSKLIPMIDAVNRSIHSILAENSNNRVGVVVYSGTEYTQTIMELTSSPGIVESVRIGSKTYNFQNAHGSIPSYIGYNITENKTKVQSGRRYTEVVSSIEVTLGAESGYSNQKESGGTYTQCGIVQAAEMLYNSYDDGIQRLPSILILSDGEATYGNASRWNASSASSFKAVNSKGYDVGDGTSSSSQLVEVGYNTIMTANYWKKRLTDKYTERNGVTSSCRFYSLGFALNTCTKAAYAAGVLNPASLDEPFSDNGGTAAALKSRLKNTSNPYFNNYYYADTYYSAVGENELAKMLQDFAANVVLPTRSYNTKLTR